MVARHQRADLRQRGPQRLEQGHSARGKAHALGPPREEFVTKQFPQACEVVTHRGLTNADAGRRARDAPFREERIEMNEEIQVNTT